jgi:hypothetical protein
MMDGCQRYRFSVTRQTSDRAVLRCLRALCQWAEEYPKKQIGRGGTGDSRWRTSGGQLTLRFTSPEFRARFILEASRLLPGHWQMVAKNDNDPTTRQRM